jgi:Zn ribbon nucleic-acid-binding protein
MSQLTNKKNNWRNERMKDMMCIRCGGVMEYVDSENAPHHYYECLNCDWDTHFTNEELEKQQ